MRRLNNNEIKFIKETGWTPTVYQCDEYDRTTLKDLDTSIEVAKNEYDIDLLELYDKTCNLDNNDGISLEYEATYLFYTFFTKEELEKMTDAKATAWLKDFKYYFGYRKWDGGNIIYVNEALDVYNGTREFYEEDDGDVWNREVN